MGWIATSKKKAAARLEDLPTSDKVYQTQPMQPYTLGPFHHEPYHLHRQHLGVVVGFNNGYIHPPPHPGYYYQPPPNAVVNHYCVAAPGAPGFPRHAQDQGNGRSRVPAALGNPHLGSVANLATDLLPVNLLHFFDNGSPSGRTHGETLVDQRASLYDQLSHQFDSIMTSIDNDQFDSLEVDLSMESCHTSANPAQAVLIPSQKYASRNQLLCSLSPSIKPGSFFAKVDLYANARLPYDLPPVQL